MPITALYAAPLAILFIALSMRVIQWRRSQRVEIGDGEDRELLRRMRVQANYAEYVPIALILIALAESLKASPAALHVLGLALLVGRVMHAYGLSQSPHILNMRVFGMMLTMAAIIGAALLALGMAVPHIF